jgi:nitroimidazol reductase NimA-like FMN-containing flavoprotein (pyridoxamine 5'-phosphate oxidase superfamily)
MSEVRPMRRITKAVTEQERIDSLLGQARVGYLGLVDQEGTYVVPLNFVWHQGKIYFHGSHEGRKVDALAQEGTYCFTVSEELGTITNPVPANTGTAYLSVMAFGPVEKVSLEEATVALQAMLDKYVPGYFPTDLSQSHVEKYRSKAGASTAVFRLTPIRLTAKEDPGDPQAMFYPGRTLADDLEKNK